jgi:hypothetical protein
MRTGIRLGGGGQVTPRSPPRDRPGQQQIIVNADISAVSLTTAETSGPVGEKQTKTCL